MQINGSSKRAAFRKQLISLRVENPSVAQYQRILQSMIQQFSDLENTIESAIAADRAPSDIPALNRVLAKQADKLNEMLSYVRKAMEQNDD